MVQISLFTLLLMHALVTGNTITMVSRNSNTMLCNKDVHDTILYPEYYDMITTWFVLVVLLGFEQVCICVQDEATYL